MSRPRLHKSARPSKRRGTYGSIGVMVPKMRIPLSSVRVGGLPMVWRCGSKAVEVPKRCFIWLFAIAPLPEDRFAVLVESQWFIDLIQIWLIRESTYTIYFDNQRAFFDYSECADSAEAVDSSLPSLWPQGRSCNRPFGVKNNLPLDATTKHLFAP